MPTHIVIFRCPYCRQDESGWSLDLGTFEAMAAGGPAHLTAGVEDMEGQAVLAFGGPAGGPRRTTPCRHTVSLCVDAELHTGDGGRGGPPGRTVASAGITWDHPLLIASDPDKHLRYHLWEEYETDEEEGLDPATAAWRPRLTTPYLIRRVTTAPRRVGSGRHLHVSGTVMVAADVAAFVAGLRDGYHRLSRFESGPIV